MSESLRQRTKIWNDGSGKSFPRRLVPSSQCHSPAPASFKERPEDIPLLVNHFLQKSAENLGVEPKIMSEEAMEFLKRFPFPGNVRQLENLCNWLVVMAPSQHIRVTDLPEEISAAKRKRFIKTARFQARRLSAEAGRNCSKLKSKRCSKVSLPIS